MNRNEFIETIMSLYPDTFKSENERHFQLWIDRYKSAISANWDFDKLMKYFDREYKSTIVPPHPSFFYQFKESVRSRAKEQSIKKLTPEEVKKSEEAFKKFQEKMRVTLKGKIIQ